MILKWLFPGPTPEGVKTPQGPEPMSEGIETVQPRTERTVPSVTLPTKQEVLTETAALIVYDLAALNHRLDDDVDWWADPKDELEELNKRNLLIVGVQADGFYDVEVEAGQRDDGQKFSLHFPSGEVFIGPGEEVTGGGNSPSGEHGGFFLSLDPGDYEVVVSRVDDERISIVLERGAPFENSISEPVRI